MNKLKTMAIGFVFLFGITVSAQDLKTAKVMEELFQLHDLLVKESPSKWNVKKLETLLEKGGDSKKDTEVFKKAKLALIKLGEADSLPAKRDAYAELIEILSVVALQNDKSGARVFYCPMVKKKWISKGDTIVNPYDKEMRNCGEKI